MTKQAVTVLFSAILTISALLVVHFSTGELAADPMEVESSLLDGDTSVVCRQRRDELLEINAPTDGAKQQWFDLLKSNAFSADLNGWSTLNSQGIQLRYPREWNVTFLSNQESDLGGGTFVFADKEGAVVPVQHLVLSVTPLSSLQELPPYSEALQLLPSESEALYISPGVQLNYYFYCDQILLHFSEGPSGNAFSDWQIPIVINTTEILH
jgi:hypothetical protein